MYLFSVESTINVKITGFEWARSLQLEHYEPVQKEDWSLPQGAYNVSNFQGIHHYDKVLQGYVTRTRWVKVPSGTRRYVCGKTSTGNGYYQDRYCTETTYRDKQESYQDPVYRDVPVYRTKYRFDIKTWVEKDVLRTTQKNQTPVWAQSENLKQEGWREGKKEETYWLYIKDPDENIHKEKVPFSRWTKYKLHADIPARKRWITGKYLGLEEKKE
jgi:hypothetical protein